LGFNKPISTPVTSGVSCRAIPNSAHIHSVILTRRSIYLAVWLSTQRR